MPRIAAIDAICFSAALRGHEPRDISPLISRPYDVLTREDRDRLLARNPQNIVALDLPHYPPKAAGPTATYEAAARQMRQWLAEGVLQRVGRRVLLVYEQIYSYRDRPHVRRGLIANLPVQALGAAPDGAGGIYPHEQTFSGPKEDRLRLMQATQCQLSPIFGMYTDPEHEVGPILAEAVARPPAFCGTTDDGVAHRVWIVDDERTQQRLRDRLYGKDVYIADGHHRYTTALNYRAHLRSAGAAPPAAGWCMFVLVSMQDPGMLILPTHRVLSGLHNFSIGQFCEAAKDKLKVCRFDSADLAELEAALPHAEPHAIGRYDPAEADPHRRLWIATPVQDDPLAGLFPNQSRAWRQLDVAIAQHLIVERICQPAFGHPGTPLSWAFPHTLRELQDIADSSGCGLGMVMQPTPLPAVQNVSQAGELMPQKSTFFYPKLASGLVINPLS